MPGPPGLTGATGWETAGYCPECKSDVSRGDWEHCVDCRTRFHRYGPGGHGVRCAACRPGGTPAGQWAPGPDDRPVPARMTMALDLRGLYGPEVDQACGVAEPVVDEWETGQRVPTWPQMQALARLTGYPAQFFYLPVPAGRRVVYICDRTKRRHGLAVVESLVDEHGVMTKIDHTPPRKR